MLREPAVLDKNILNQAQASWLKETFPDADFIEDMQEDAQVDMWNYSILLPFDTSETKLWPSYHIFKGLPLSWCLDLRDDTNTSDDFDNFQIFEKILAKDERKAADTEHPNQYIYPEESDFILRHRWSEGKTTPKEVCAMWIKNARAEFPKSMKDIWRKEKHDELIKSIPGFQKARSASLLQKLGIDEARLKTQVLRLTQ